MRLAWLVLGAAMTACAAPVEGPDADGGAAGDATASDVPAGLSAAEMALIGTWRLDRRSVTGRTLLTYEHTFRADRTMTTRSTNSVMCGAEGVVQLAHSNYDRTWSVGDGDGGAVVTFAVPRNPCAIINDRDCNGQSLEADFVCSGWNDPTPRPYAVTVTELMLNTLDGEAGTYTRQ